MDTRARVFPAQAGVYLSHIRQHGIACSFPRASGGVPLQANLPVLSLMFSPRKRGCTCQPVSCKRHRMSFPHASGGVPSCSCSDGRSSGFSPRKRGCTGTILTVGSWSRVFPAQAGVYPGTLGGCIEADYVFPARAGVYPILAS